jgi:hypothetical protein
MTAICAFILTETGGNITYMRGILVVVKYVIKVSHILKHTIFEYKQFQNKVKRCTAEHSAYETL